MERRERVERDALPRELHLRHKRAAARAGKDVSACPHHGEEVLTRTIVPAQHSMVECRQAVLVGGRVGRAASRDEPGERHVEGADDAAFCGVDPSRSCVFGHLFSGKGSGGGSRPPGRRRPHPMGAAFTAASVKGSIFF